jgi:hypothetical protein
MLGVAPGKGVYVLPSVRWHVDRELITAPVDRRLLLAVNVQSTVMLVLQCVSVQVISINVLLIGGRLYLEET